MNQLTRTSVALALMFVAAEAIADPFHTSPECWDEARIYHPGPPPAELANRIHVIEAPKESEPPGEPTVSPNGAYRFWVRNPDTTAEGPWGAGLIVDVERKTRPTILFENVAQPIQPHWINEKLIFVRVVWGRMSFSDLILDAEKREIIYHEEARDGGIAFEQYKQACGENCPCEVPKAEAAALPQSQPAADVIIGLLRLPTVFGPPESGGVVQADEPKPVAVYAEPDAQAEVIAHPDNPEDFAYREIGYEEGAAIVYEKTRGWFRIGLTQKKNRLRYGWIKAADGGHFSSVQDLLPGRLAYLNEHWNGELWSAPEGEATVFRSRLKKADGRQEYGGEIREARQTKNGLWLRVALYDGDPCAGDAPSIAEEGWVPAYSTNGQLLAWYHSRGC